MFFLHQETNRSFPDFGLLKHIQEFSLALSFTVIQYALNHYTSTKYLPHNHFQWNLIGVVGLRHVRGVQPNMAANFGGGHNFGR